MRAITPLFDIDCAIFVEYAHPNLKEIGVRRIASNKLFLIALSHHSIDQSKPTAACLESSVLAACMALENSIVLQTRKPQDKNFDHANINYLGVGTLHVCGNASVDGTLIVNNIEVHGHAQGGFVRTLTGDTGGPRPPDAAGNINVLGTGVISVAGAGNTLTISSAGGASGVQALQGNTGGPIGPDGSGIIFVPGDHGINTDGAGNTVTIAVDNTLTLGDLADVTGSAALTATTGNVNIVAGNLLLPNTAASGNAGQIQLNGTRFVHNFGTSNTFVGSASGNLTLSGIRNTGLGFNSLIVNTTGANNTAAGANALLSNTTGDLNVAVGAFASSLNLDGTLNTALGAVALRRMVSGSSNTAAGFGALTFLTNGGTNTALGSQTLANLVNGNGNSAVGSNAGFAYTGSETDNILIENLGTIGDSGKIRIGTDGTHDACFIAGIRGATTGVADAVAVLIDSAGQLGTISSSRRFKTEIRNPMENEMGKIALLEPQAFRYLTDPEGTVRYGLIAEDVAKIAPWLVVYDAEGLPYTVKYHELSIALLQELRKLSSEVESLRNSLIGLAILEQSVQRLQGEITKLTTRQE